jgi:hypothetical protein
MAATKLAFSVRVSAKTVHLVGSWDSYKGQLPLSQDSSKKSAWRGTFRFSGSTLKPGQTYWYYYVIDGYHVSHDPAKPSVVEPKTGRTLNTLNLLPSKSSSHSNSSAKSHDSSKKVSSSSKKSSSSSSRKSTVAQGRPVSRTDIRAPVPVKPTKSALSTEHGSAMVEHLVKQLDNTTLSENINWDDWSHSDDESDTCSDVPSLCSSGSIGSRASSTSLSSPGSTSPDVVSYRMVPQPVTDGKFNHEEWTETNIEIEDLQLQA